MPDFHNLPDITLHYSFCRGIKVVAPDGSFLGKLTDFFVDYDEIYPAVLAVQYAKGGSFFYVPWGDILHFSPGKIVTREGAFVGNGHIYPKAPTAASFPPLGKVVLDRQIIDTNGKKVVRVNDIQFMRSENDLRVTHTCIGLRSMIRRLGLEPLVDLLITGLRPRSAYLKSDVLIDWKHVHAIPGGNPGSELRIALRGHDVKDIHPADLADILEDLDARGRAKIFQELDPKTTAEILPEIEEDVRQRFAREAVPRDFAKIITEMDTDDATDVLGGLEPAETEQIIDHIPDDEYKKIIQNLLKYDEDSAGGLMTTTIFEIPPETKKSKVLQIIKEKYLKLDAIYDLYIIDSRRKLLGVCPLHKILAQDGDPAVGKIMQKDDIKTLPPDTHWKDLARHMRKYDLITAPVVDQENNLLGIVAVDDVLDCLLKD